MRSLLEQLHLEITLRARRLDVHAPEPLSRLIVAGASSSWCAQSSEIWKWVLYGDYPSDRMLAYLSTVASGARSA
jgi:hypothetical protein